MHVVVCAGECRYWERMEEPELQALLHCPVWMLGTKLGTSVRAARSPSQRAIIQPIIYLSK